MNFIFRTWSGLLLNSWELPLLVFCGRDFCSLTQLGHLPFILKLPWAGFALMSVVLELLLLSGGKKKTLLKNTKHTRKPRSLLHYVMDGSACLVDLEKNNLQIFIRFDVFLLCITIV